MNIQKITPDSFKNLGIGKKLSIGFSIILALLLVISFTSYSSINHINERYAHLLGEKEEFAVLENAYDISINMLQARRSEKDFLLRKKLKYAERVKRVVSKAQEEINLIRKVKEDVNDMKGAEEAENLLKLSETYLKSFLQVVDITTKKGLTPKTGIYGKLRTSANEVEDLISSISLEDYGLDRMFEEYLQLRRNEKNYFLQGRDLYLKKIEKILIKMIAAFSKTDLYEEEKQDMINALKFYGEQIKVFASIHKKQKASIEEMRDAVHKMTPILEDFLSHTSEQMNNKVIANSNYSEESITIIATVSLIAIIAGILLSFMIGLQILTPVRKIETLAKDLSEGEGDLTVRLQMNSRDEIGKTAQYIDLFMDKLNRTISGIIKETQNVYHASNKTSTISRKLSANAVKEKKNLDDVIFSMEEMSVSVKQIAGNANSVSSRINDIAEKSDAIGEGMENLSKLAENVSEEVDGTLAAMEEMARSAEGIASNVETSTISLKDVESSGIQMKEKISEALAASKTISLEINSVADAVTEQLASIEDVSESANKANELSKQSSVKAVEGKEKVNELLHSIMTIKEKVFETGDSISHLNKIAEDISAITNTIGEISEQTNLLALNAAIEAARAGQHGRGFAVVADEVRKLAERSALSNNEIAQLVETIQQNVKITSQKTNESIKEVEKGSSLADDTGSVIDEIVDKSNEASEHVMSIANAAREQANVSKDIVKRVEKTNSSCNDIVNISHELDHSEKVIKDCVEDLSQIMQHVNNATIEQGETVKQVVLSAEMIQNKVAAISDTIKDQTEDTKATIIQINQMATLVEEVSQAVAEQTKLNDNVVELSTTLSNANDEGLKYIKEIEEASHITGEVSEKLKEFTDSFKV